MTCRYYGKEGKCKLHKDLYCAQENDWGYCRSNGIVDRDDPV
jgi:hypothetical protein